MNLATTTTLLRLPDLSRYPSWYRLVPILWLLFYAARISAQDIESVAKAPILTANGGISLNQIATFTPGEDAATADPYSLYLAGNLNISLLGVVSVPLSFAYTNSQLNTDMSLPFNRFSIAPSYKWVKLYAGYTSMQFSPYSLAGHELCGGGVELTPNNGWKVSALYGRLRKPVSATDGADPSYQRMGGGFKVEYTGKQWDVGVNLFKAKDQPSSVYFPNPDSIAITPQDNLSGSITTNIALVKNLRWGAEYGISNLNRNIGRESVGDVAVYHAMKTNLAYTLPVGTIGTTYERVAPNYTTLGAYYMTNDYENITANISTTIKKFNIAIDGGYQRDNLNDQKSNTTSRMIFSGNVSANLTDKLSIGANFSNVQSYMYINDIYSQVTQTNEFQNLDTLNVTQLNYTTSGTVSYLLQNTKDIRQGINANLMYQKSAEKQEFSKFAGNDIYNLSLSYQYAITPAKFNASTGINYNNNQMPDNQYTQATTYNLSLQKVFFEQLKSVLSATYSDMSNQIGSLSGVLNIRLTAGYVFLKNHNVNLNIAMVRSEGHNKTRLQYSANLAYSYIFNASLSRKEKKLYLNGNF